MTNDRAFNMDFGKVYGILTDKACRKGRTAEKVAEVTCRLTGYTHPHRLPKQQDRPSTGRKK